MRIEGIWGMIVGIIIVLTLGLFAYCCLILSSKYDNDDKNKK